MPFRQLAQQLQTQTTPDLLSLLPPCAHARLHPGVCGSGCPSHIALILAFLAQGGGTQGAGSPQQSQADTVGTQGLEMCPKVSLSSLVFK